MIALLLACAGPALEPGDTADSGAPAPPTLADELGLTEYLGASAVQGSSTADGVTTWAFEPDAPARCLRGDAYRMATRDTGSEDLLVFLQGGGACWSDFCLAVAQAPEGIPGVDILRTDLAENPVADWNVAYLPYCDGSLFVGDRDHDDDGDGEIDRLHRGLANLSAGLSVAAQELPPPRRVLFAGSSGGGFGVLLTSTLVRHVFPDAEIVVLADSAIGVARGPSDPAFVQQLMDEFGADRFLPQDCPDCLAQGHIAPLVDWTLQRDPDLRVGVFTSWYDYVMGEIFLQVPAADFAAAVDSETSRTHAAFPDRYRRFVIDGRMHTTLLGDATGIVGSDLSSLEVPPEVLAQLAGLELGSLQTTASADGGSVSAWVGALVDGDLQGWADVVDPAGSVPE